LTCPLLPNVNKAASEVRYIVIFNSGVWGPIKKAVFVMEMAVKIAVGNLKMDSRRP
jgi:hypothetical protein